MTLPPIPRALTFDDVLLTPRFSAVHPADADMTSVLCPGLALAVPLLSAAMDTVTEAPMATALALAGALGVVHKNMAPAAQAEQVRLVKEADPSLSPALARDAAGRLRAGAALGVGPDRAGRAQALVEAGVDLLVLDTAHGHSRAVLAAVAETRAEHPHVPILAGNVATAEGTLALLDAGASCVKVGIGPGSICTTRVVSGVGMPQLSAVLACAAAARARGAHVVADGGVRFSGDIVKALAAGAGAVMLGSVLAGTDSAPGEAVTVDGRAFRRYRGMGSLGAMARGSAERYGQAAGEPRKLVPEGVEGLVPATGPVAEVLHQLTGGLRAGMGYLGAATLTQLREHAQFIEITAAGGRESHVHDLVAPRDAPNYRR